ncbi:MAG: Ldh family oxidoreductase [Pikeienuella sp.]
MQESPGAEADMVRLDVDALPDLVRRVLRAHGFDAPNAQAIAENMSRAEAGGSASHGLFRLPGHVRAVRAGKANPVAVPRLESLAPGVLRVDGDRGFTPLAHRVGLGALLEAAQAQGVALLAITRTMHYAALWPEVEWLAERGIAALAMTSSPPYVAPAGGCVPVFGTNPVAFAWPREGAAPVAFDMATAEMARGEIMVHARDGRPVPETAGIDADGQPTTDPTAILDGGAQLPFGGHKGAALALMVDLLAGPLIGEATSLEAGARAPLPGLTEVAGELILAIDPQRMGARLDGAEALFRAIQAQPSARLPGEARAARRARIMRDGVALPGVLHRDILALLG